jgi:N6-adenosine-specific RNA methylase IME4
MLVHLIAESDALLFIWIPGPLLIDGLIVMDAWNFEYKRDAFQWNKVVTNPGYYTLTQVETCYVGKRGRIPKPRGSRNERQYLETHEITDLDYNQYIEQRRGKHSAKPAEVRNRITRMFPTQKKIELFARERVEGWDCWGNEV